jgi:hypothetical protein
MVMLLLNRACWNTLELFDDFPENVPQLERTNLIYESARNGPFSRKTLNSHFRKALDGMKWKKFKGAPADQDEYELVLANQSRTQLIKNESHGEAENQPNYDSDIVESEDEDDGGGKPAAKPYETPPSKTKTTSREALMNICLGPTTAQKAPNEVMVHGADTQAPAAIQEASTEKHTGTDEPSLSQAPVATHEALNNRDVTTSGIEDPSLNQAQTASQDEATNDKDETPTGSEEPSSDQVKKRGPKIRYTKRRRPTTESQGLSGESDDDTPLDQLGKSSSVKRKEPNDATEATRKSPRPPKKTKDDSTASKIKVSKKSKKKIGSYQRPELNKK